MEFYCQIVNKSKIIPLNNSDYEVLSKLKNNTDYKITIVQPRNYQFHKKFFALVNLFYENQSMSDDFEMIRAYLTMKAGFKKMLETSKGTVYFPESINFAKMDNIRFEQVYKRVLDVVWQELGSTKEEIEQELINFM